MGKDSKGLSVFNVIAIPDIYQRRTHYTHNKRSGTSPTCIVFLYAVLSTPCQHVLWFEFARVLSPVQSLYGKDKNDNISKESPFALSGSFSETLLTLVQGGLDRFSCFPIVAQSF